MKNRIFAYLVNVDVNDFNKLEMEVMKKLNFDVLVAEEDFESYENQLDQYSLIYSSLINTILLEYKHDKRYLRKFRKHMKEQMSQSTEAASMSKNQHRLVNCDGTHNYMDWRMRHMFESQGWKVVEPEYP